ncbi:PP2C family protein-serine/threonine phosphatase [Streptomyces somaliensis]|uniref:Serine/threonine-protein phosphatase n=1 Tax=Streptomyces somaliensis (strain ATCC 33201 / DSM 40738 / JCM 12659 / KCTC 9044 / NCTC 11332 / NRRL B-12077 / IP 733) TaxID=1134445 RepID=A0AA44DH67_STRE0|nr:PP2C family protein-serine/threonine phosphatase [Streptomyces somaliensis]NKY16380.1 serine/threonine-protein phosphatase [Streptomyces somaliensis DSM 40738]
MYRVRREPPGVRPALWLRLLPWGLLAGVLVAQGMTPGTVQLGFALAVVAPLASLAHGALGTALVSAALTLVLALPHPWAPRAGGGDLLALGLIGVVSVLLARARVRREAQLTRVRTIAEAAQYAVLPPVPPRVGPVECGALYRAAGRAALVGGDLYDVQPGPYGVRAVVADVKGHGLSAVSTVSALLGAFREAVLDEPELTGVAARLDRRLVVDSSREGETELFATALLVEFPAGPGRGCGARVLSRGHPPPLLVAPEGVREVVLESGPPLGLGAAGSATPPPVTVPLEPSCVLLAYTDGVSEARDAAGEFYPLPQRVRPGQDPAALVGSVWRDVSAYAGEIDDDVALLALRVAPGG